jgi:hypothetical protein
MIKCLNNNQVKLKIKNMIKHRIRPCIATSNNGEFDKLKNYNSNYKYIEWDNKEFLKNHVENINSSLISCIYDYPECYVYLVGYSNNNNNNNNNNLENNLDNIEYISELFTIYTPFNKFK